MITWLLGVLLGGFVALAFLVIGTPAFVLLALAIIASVRSGAPLISISGLLSGAGAGILLLELQAALRCTAENRQGAGFVSGCTPPDVSALVVIATTLALIGVALGLVALGRGRLLGPAQGR